MNKINIILFLIITIVIIKIFFNYNENYITNNNIEIVVSRYNERLDWLKDEPFNDNPVIIYNKGNNDDYINASNIIKTIKLSNVGREGHTYLYHIINNYNNLADVTVFLPGSVNLSYKYERSKNIIKKVKETMNTIFACTVQENIVDENYNFQLDKYLSTDHSNNKINKDDNMKLSKTRPYGKWFNNTFKNGEKNNCIASHGIFAISKEHILQKPKSYYENLIIELNDHHNPEVGHYFERSWYAVFYPYNENINIIN